VADPNLEVILRSSCTNEGLEDRGRYESVRCKPVASELLEAIRAIWKNFVESKLDATSQMAIIVQVFVYPLASGHFSNERRVSQRQSRWLCEISQPPVPAHLIVIDTQNRRASQSRRGALAGLVRNIRIAASQYTKKTRRSHFEFVWDGQTLWIVQMDREVAVEGHRPLRMWARLPNPVEPASLQVLTNALLAKGNWKKTRSVKLFSELDLPVANLYVLEDHRTIRDLANKKFSAALRNDLSVLITYPIIIRTDVKSSLFVSLLPRSDCLMTQEMAEDYLHETAKILLRDYKDTEICFIIHRFIPAEACAQVLAKVNNPKVRVDATWGLPDGLQYFPYDSYEVDTVSGRIRKKLRCKTRYLDVDAEEKWVTSLTGPPWDWRQSISNDVVNQIGHAAITICKKIGKAVDVMFFIGIRKESGHPYWLPWLHLPDVSLPTMDRDTLCGPRISTNQVVIRSSAELERLEQPGIPKSKNILALQPNADLLRDRDFLARVARLAKRLNWPIDLDGSILSHAYYFLTKEGARVRCIDYFNPTSRRQRFNKLVRDYIPITIQQHGEKANVYEVAPTDFVLLLKQKLVEEALEVVSGTTDEEIKEELADLIEVITSIRGAYGIEEAELKRLMATKREKRGGFERGLFLVDTVEEPLIKVAEPGLFKDSSASQSRRVGARPNLLRRGSVRRRGNSLIISLIPPPSLTTDKKIRTGDYVIQYLGKEVTVELQSLEDRPDPHQMVFDFMKE
jgi:predicted house-cleaning noncanonical NTP pyrophosphatase (MazG superfamily)